MTEHNTIYHDIAVRTGGNIYIGVVGPVRSGKSTFIKRFMEEMVLPNMEEGAKKERAKDEMPQSASGKRVMTTEPKFIPEEAVGLETDDGVSFHVKMIDCVGYAIPEAILDENGAQRMVTTPWSKEEIPFEEAARIGTRKVIEEHATVGVFITTDGTIGNLERNQYTDAEEQVYAAMKKTGKPFVVLLITKYPDSDETKILCDSLAEKYKTSVLPINCLEMTRREIWEVLNGILMEFPTKEVAVTLPSWILSLDDTNEVKCAFYKELTERFGTKMKTSECLKRGKNIANHELVQEVTFTKVDLSCGKAKIKVEPIKDLYWNVLSEKSGIEIRSEEKLLQEFSYMAKMKANYEKIENALLNAQEKGYGIITPEKEDMTLEMPQIVRQSGGYGVKLKASAPSIHLIRANIEAEIAPIVGTERQSEDIVKFLLKEFEEEPSKIWESNLFGKSLYELVNEGLHNKLNHMPEESRLKLGDTLQKIINEGSGGLICIIL